jgi:hypothetical protein
MDMAIQLQAESGYTDLDPEDTWHLDEHLTPLQQRQFTASNELFALSHEMDEAAKSTDLSKVG